MVDAEAYANAADITLAIYRLKEDGALPVPDELPENIGEHFHRWLHLFDYTKQKLEETESLGVISGEDNIYRRMLVNNRVQHFILNRLKVFGWDEEFEERVTQYHVAQLSIAISAPGGQPLPDSFFGEIR